VATDTQLTPMIAQYRRIKGELPADALLLFRLGDFYEMFFEDAQLGAQILNVALTKRGVVPMCGIPFHAATGYISKLLKAGRKVALCEQLEEARPGQLVKREVTQILSPGTHFDERLLVAEKNNYLAAVYAAGKTFGLALIDLTTGDFRVTELDSEQGLIAELERVRPAEVVFPSESSIKNLLQNTAQICTGYDDWTFAAETAEFTVRDHFKVSSLDGFGLRGRSAAIGACGGMIHYLATHLRRDLNQLSRLQLYQAKDFLILDAMSLRNLEILEPLHADGPRTRTLFGALNRTVTPMGSRKLRDWLTQPLASVEAIHRRQALVQLWMDNRNALQSFREELKEVRDLERVIGRLCFSSGNARDLVALRVALGKIPAIRAILEQLKFPPTRSQENLIETGSPGADPLADVRQRLQELPVFTDLREHLEKAVVDDPPLNVKEGGMIRDGYDAALDELKQASTKGKEWIARLQQEEIEKTGITSLKVRFNSVFGYYLEVTKTNLDKVPPHYIRKQTIANGERFITPELKEMEGKILGAEERSTKLEYEIFLRLREEVIKELANLQRAAAVLAELDVLATFADIASVYNYCCPVVKEEGVLEIIDGRHPVIDLTVVEERFIPNDVHLDLKEQQIMLITGPNMAGKSTYIRQTALLALLAHTGCFLPAKRARVDLVDRIFTRIGASDDLARGQSTFMVEMSETANILNNATPRSLVILDEIGRGTSTFDGLSLAWSIVEYLHHQVGAKTLFATHYHELTELAGRLPRTRNFNVAVREWNDQIIFLRKIVPGGTDKSYGIQVARLAGVPKPVLDRAKDILRNLEEAELSPEGRPRHSGGRHRAEREKLKSLAPPPQMDLFSSFPAS
jgi:DNA mismatch repair protein MutS